MGLTPSDTLRPWVSRWTAELGAKAPEVLAALVGLSSFGEDAAGLEELVGVVCERAPAAATVQRLPCSTAGRPDDVLIRLRGSGDARLLLLGHLDTVVPRPRHRPLTRDSDRLVGTGAADMKGGVAVALGILEALGERSGQFAEVALLLVLDEEGRAVPLRHGERFRGWDACLCFEAGELDETGAEAVVVRRKARATLRVRASGVAAHAAVAPERGRNALLGLASAALSLARIPQDEPGRLSLVPSVMSAGQGPSVVPDRGELLCDMRAPNGDVFAEVLASVPEAVDGVWLQADLMRRSRAMDTKVATASVLADASRHIRTRIGIAGRAGTSDAAEMAAVIPCTIDGLGPRGGDLHAPTEYVLAESVPARIRVALAVVDAILVPREPR